MINNGIDVEALVDRYRNELLDILELSTVKDMYYLGKDNVVYVVVDTIEVDGEILTLTVADEQYSKLVNLVNAVKSEIKPNMQSVQPSGNITAEIINQLLKVLSMLLHINIKDVVLASFTSEEDMLDYFGLIEEKGEEELVELEKVVTKDAAPGFVVELKHRVEKEIQPSCKTFTLDLFPINSATPSTILKVTTDEISRVIKSYEEALGSSKIDVVELAEKASNAETEVSKLKSSMLVNKDTIMQLEKIIESNTEKEATFTKDVDTLLLKVDTLEKAAKSKEMELVRLKAVAVIDPDDVLDNEDISESHDFLYNMPAEEVKKLLLKFIADKDIANSIKSPLVLDIFDYIMKSNR